MLLQDDDAASTCSSRSRLSENTEKSASKRASRCQSRDSEILENFDWTPLEGDEAKHPIQMLVQAAAMMNPKQFDLPKDTNCPVKLPGIIC